MRRAWHTSGSECHHRAHGCGKSLTLWEWFRLWRILRQLRKRLERELSSRA